MKGLKWMILITQREDTDKYLSFLRENGIERIYTKFCQGTATSSVLDMFGLASTDKVMIESVVRDEHLERIKANFIRNTNITERGTGVAAFINMGAVGGELALKELVGEAKVKVLEEEKMNEQFCMIITIADSGNSDIIMHSAREAGATGGTVVRAMGTGKDMAKFFGLTISEEKDMVYIIAKKTQRDSIMQALMASVGANTDAHGIVFSLPIDSVLGIKGFENIKVDE